MTSEQRKALALLVHAVIDAVKADGELGTPGGVLYAALMTQGCTLEQFEGLMSGLCKGGALTKRGDCYYAA